MSADPVAEIRRLYFETTAASVERDLERAVDLFKRISTEEDRERAAVYMDGLSQMRSEWAPAGTSRSSGGGSAGRARRTGRKRGR